jgi:hypothetical protein
MRRTRHHNSNHSGANICITKACCRSINAGGLGVIQATWLENDMAGTAARPMGENFAPRPSAAARRIIRFLCPLSTNSRANSAIGLTADFSQQWAISAPFLSVRRWFYNFARLSRAFTPLPAPTQLDLGNAHA